jgi:CelD/BcsL family acetyltransferase involved in cellulose biosynthesis
VNGPSDAYACSVLEGPDSLTALEWAELHARSPGAYVSEGVDWAELCWRSWAGRSRAKLLCLVVRRDTRLVATLPLVVSRHGPFRIAKPLACMTTEYFPLLTDPAAEAPAIWKAMTGKFRHLTNVDAILLPNVRDEGAVAFLEAAPSVRRTGSVPSLFLSRSAFGSWDSYWAERSNRVKSNVRRGRGRLQKLGELTFEELTDPDARRAAWRWMISQKRDWLVRKGLQHPFIPTSAFSRFTEATLGISGPTGRRAIFVLKLNGELLAAELVNIDRTRVELFVCTYDPSFSQYAPGNVLRHEVVRWAFAQGLDYDWRLGDEDYKRDWACRTAAANTYVLARNLRGGVFAVYLAARTQVANHTPGALRSAVRKLLRSPAAIA